MKGRRNYKLALRGANPELQQVVYETEIVPHAWHLLAYNTHDISAKLLISFGSYGTIASAVPLPPRWFGDTLNGVTLAWND